MAARQWWACRCVMADDPTRLPLSLPVIAGAEQQRTGREYQQICVRPIHSQSRCPPYHLCCIYHDISRKSAWVLMPMVPPVASTNHCWLGGFCIDMLFGVGPGLQNNRDAWDGRGCMGLCWDCHPLTPWCTEGERGGDRGRWLVVPGHTHSDMDFRHVLRTWVHVWRHMHAAVHRLYTAVHCMAAPRILRAGEYNPCAVS